MSCIAFVPVRCGSKSIPLKNIKIFCGMPLIYWNLQELEHTSNVDKIVVATDCTQIEEVVKGFNFSKVEIYRRRPENASDTSSTESVMLEYLDSNVNLDPQDIFLLVQVTSPLTSRVHFAEALSTYVTSTNNSMLSCVRIKKFMWTENGKALNYDYQNRPRRQDFTGVLIENGAFYINTVRNIQRDLCRLSDNVGVYEMPEHTFIEIDEDEDWVIAEGLMKKYYSYFPAVVNTSFSNIKLVATDVDGVLTDAGMYYSENGDELKKFNTRDGKGFELLRNEGIKTAIITSENTQIVTQRGKKLKADYVIQGVTGIDKLNVLKSICEKENVNLIQCAYIGDDINCIPLLQEVGIAFCPRDAESEVKKVKNIILLDKNGGEGVFREAVSLILKK